MKTNRPQGAIVLSAVALVPYLRTCNYFWYHVEWVMVTKFRKKTHTRWAE